MEAELAKKISEVKETHKGTIGVLLVDNLGLPVESQGNFEKGQSGLISSIMKNAAKLEAILNPASQEEQSQSAKADNFTKIYFAKESLVIRNKNGLNLALRQDGGL